MLSINGKSNNDIWNFCFLIISFDLHSSLKWGRYYRQTNISNSLNHLAHHPKKSNYSMSSVSGKPNYCNFLKNYSRIGLYWGFFSLSESKFKPLDSVALIDITNAKSLRLLKEGSHPSKNRLMQKTSVAQLTQPATKEVSPNLPVMYNTSNLFINHLLHSFQVTGTQKKALMSLAHVFKLNLMMLVAATSCLIQHRAN